MRSDGRNIAVFDDVKGAMQEAEYCAESEDKLYAIIQFGGYFGVLPKAQVMKEDIIYETIVPKSQYQ